MSESKAGWKELQISSSHTAGIKCASFFSKICQLLHILSHKTPIKYLKNSPSAISQLMDGDNYLGLIYVLHKKWSNLSSSWLFSTLVMMTWWAHHLYPQERWRLTCSETWKGKCCVWFFLSFLFKNQSINQSNKKKTHTKNPTTTIKLTSDFGRFSNYPATLFHILHAWGAWVHLLSKQPIID